MAFSTIPAPGKGHRFEIILDNNTVIKGTHGVVDFQPNHDVETAHNSYQLASDLDKEFQEGQKLFRHRMKLFFKLVGMTDYLALPDSFYKVWLKPDSGAVAANHYDSNGSSYITLEVDDLQRACQRKLSHILCHEANHLWSLHQYYSTAWKQADEHLEVDLHVFQIGLACNQTLNYTVRRITQDDWASFINVVFAVKDAFKSGKTMFEYSASTKVHAMIAMTKAKFGPSWLDDVIEIIRSKKQEIFNIRTWTAEVSLNIGDPANETLVEFTARVQNLEDMLEPTIHELKWFEKNGGYQNMSAIMDLMTFYNNLARTERLNMLIAIAAALLHIELDPLTNFFTRHEAKLKASDIIEANFLPASMAVSPMRAIGNIFRSLCVEEMPSSEFGEGHKTPKLLIDIETGMGFLPQESALP